MEEKKITENKTESKKKSLWDEISWKLWWWKMSRLSNKLSREIKYNRKHYCLKGRHRIKLSVLKVTKYHPGSKRMIVVLNVRFFECYDCNMKFFISEKTKQKYSEYKKYENEKNKKIIERLYAMNPEQLKEKPLIPPIAPKPPKVRI